MAKPPDSAPTPRFTSVHDFCLHLLESGDLESKLVPPRGFGEGGRLEDPSRAAVLLDRPVRADRIRIGSGSDRLPTLQELRDPRARAVCLERFANHELMAVELFAWALLAYPEMPRALRRGLLHVLEEEQGHVRLYVDRLAELGSGLGQNRLSDYFWQQVPGIRASSDGPSAFLCVMGLTFEQANLDFSLLYRDAFRAQGDEASAKALHRVHRDEVGHVRLAARWLKRLGDPGERDLDLYVRHVPFPLSAARAKGRRFDRAARRRAGLSEDFIEHVQRARPYDRRGPSTVVPVPERGTADPAPRPDRSTGKPGPTRAPEE